MKRPASIGKAAGTLSPEQKAFIGALPPMCRWAVCHDVDEVELTLRRWGVHLRATVFPKAGRAA